MQFTRRVLAAALLVAMPAAALKLGGSSATAPDVETAVAEEGQENLQIHDAFLGQEQKDDRLVEELGIGAHNKTFIMALDRDMKTKMLVQVGSKIKKQPAIKDPCGAISCGALTCPGGFAVTEVEGHCCPYCINPNIKLEDAVTGATGTHGGEPSTFCKDVWCFPTLCIKAVSNPSEANGHCCTTCPAL
mmetsp:Transcript_67659/g.171730  ORF Transcript_67659/g.171730 Transcript_67659/m.171730 type:complete len:189 (+) Transcript_67659:100-666(+)